MSEDLKNILGTPRNFIEEEIEKDLVLGKYQGKISTRFPPEPNGYLHIGHAKAICLNFGIAAKYGGKTNLRFDDTNPTTEDTSFVDAIKTDIQWLGFDWEDREYYASDYFETLFGYAVKLINKGLAYVDDSSSQEMADMKGTPTVAGTNSPYRDRSIEENMQLFLGMKNGEYQDGSRVLRAKIEMGSSNMHMRDPVLYRIKHEHHHRTGDDWCIYPLYDFAHGQSDSIEEISHSLCSIEFTNHRPLYDWFIEKLEIYPSRQIEFARMNVEYMVTSKRRLALLVSEGLVTSWNDPRMSSISGMRRRGYPASSIRTFCDKVGIAKRDNLIEFSLLEACVREDLNASSIRVMVVTDPIKLTISNLPEGYEEWMNIENNPEDPTAGDRRVLFEKHLYIEREDFMIDPPKKYFRMAPGGDVRLKGAYILHCESYELNPETGLVDQIYCRYYEESKSGNDTSGIKAKGTLHWVAQSNHLDAELRLYDKLFTDPTPDSHEGVDFLSFYNKESLVVVEAKAEYYLKDATPKVNYQFLRNAYFVLDQDSTDKKLIFNRTVSLKESWVNPKKN